MGCVSVCVYWYIVITVLSVLCTDVLLFRLAERGESRVKTRSGVSVNITLAWIAALNSIHCWTLQKTFTKCVCSS